ncbi:MAG: 4-(cytidine 5'-diphospho)-2-C-methyl-D-erythritol kinase [Burkholderiaceae bacterium]|nr:4-(cytidine 5'-diphospho)-2-C-methyl-D-erythritol kinase [Burkholderiaceae bacterium]
MRALHDVPAPAKLNLFLHVVGRRADGYHLLQSVFVLIDWADTLHFERRADGRLQRHDLGTALPADDLSLAAARRLQAESGSTLGADISIDKRVPWAAGLGGGSSDAASTLLALNRLWGLGWSRERLMELALRIGADVPFFIGGHNAFVEGIGEQLTPIAVPRQWFAVVKPGAGLATQDIFKHPALVRDTPAAILSGFLADAAKLAYSVNESANEGAWVKTPAYGRNDLQPPAEDCCPEVAQAAQWIAKHFGNSRMTGSGSAVFARNGMDDQPLVTWPAEALSPGWVGRMCRSLDRHPLRDWAG